MGPDDVVGVDVDVVPGALVLLTDVVVEEVVPPDVVVV